MNEQNVPELKTDNAGLVALGFALGQSHTFGLVAGRCSAAQAHGIRRLREQKLYKQCCEKWDDFCPTYLKMSRSEADRTIKLLDEFGPVYFELSQLMRISPAVFRAIAPAVSDGILHHNGEAIAITPENSEKVAAAVAEMRSTLPKKPAAEPQQDRLRLIQDLARRCSESLAELGKISGDEPVGIERMLLRTELADLQEQMLRIAGQVRN